MGKLALVVRLLGPGRGMVGCCNLPLPGRYLLHEPNPALGGSWATLTLLTLGGLLVWVSIFVPAGGLLYGLGFTLYALSFIHPIQQLLAIVRQATS